MSTVSVASDQRVYKASITREPFLFYEMRITAKLLNEGLSSDAVMNKVIDENLFQYPTEKSVKRMVKTCIQRLELLQDTNLISDTATKSQDVARQICLYAMMKQYRLVSDFMLSVVGEKYRTQDLAFGKIDTNVYFLRLQEQNEAIATWSDKTITKLKQILVKLLVDNEYLDSTKADHLNPVLLNSSLEASIRNHGDSCFLPAFNCFD